MSTLSTPMPARPITLRLGARVEQVGVDLGRRADGEAVIVADDRLQFVRRQAGLLVDLDAALAEDRRGLGVHLVGNQDLACSRSSRLLPGPVEPGPERLDVGGVDGRAAPDAQARRRVAIAGDVVGGAFAPRAAWRSPSAAPLFASASDRSANCRQTLVFERIAGSAARCPSQSRPLRPSGRARRHWRRRARSGRRGRRCRSAHSSANRSVLDRQHRRRVDRLALEHALDQLAAFGQAEDLGQRPGAACGFPAARPRAGRGSARRGRPRRPAPSARRRCATSILSHGRSYANAAEVASAMVSPSRSSAIQSPSGTRTPRGGAVPGEHHVARPIDRGEVGQLAIIGAITVGVELQLLDRVGHPAFAEALPGEHGHRPRRRASSTSPFRTRRCRRRGRCRCGGLRAGAADRASGRSHGRAAPCRASSGASGRATRWRAFREPSPAAWRRGRTRNKASGDRVWRARAPASARVSHLTLLAESTRRVGTAWPAAGCSGEYGAPQGGAKDSASSPMRTCCTAQLLEFLVTT